MIPLQTVLNAVKATVEERFDGETCYINVVPTKFSRPSFLAELAGISMLDASHDLLQVTLSIKVSAFVEVDAYTNSQVEDLARRLTSLQELFCGCSIEVGRRYLHFEKVRGSLPGLDFAECTIEAVYMDERPTKSEDWPLMRVASVAVSVETLPENT